VVIQTPERKDRLDSFITGRIKMELQKLEISVVGVVRAAAPYHG
jgi:hypothetical protein